MFIIKLFLGICGIYLGVKIGKDKGNRYKEIYLFYKSLNLATEKLLSEVEFKKQYIKQALSLKYQSTTFQSTLDKFFKDNKVILPSFITFEEGVYIKDFFETIVKNDSASLKISLKAYNNEFSKITTEKYNLYKKYYNLCIKLGFFFGFALLIMVI